MHVPTRFTAAPTVTRAVARADAGFSLIEALVALVVLAVAGIALVGTTETHVQRIASLEDRATAQWIAENRMAELAAGLHPLVDAEGETGMLGATWPLRQSTRPTDDPELAEVEIAVRAPDGMAILARLTGFSVRGAE